MTQKSLIREACDWALALRLDDIPQDVRDLARAQTLSMAAAAHAGWRHPVGGRLLRSLRGKGWAEEAARGALLTMTLDFDETAFAGHLGHASALPPVVVAAEVGAGADAVLVAQVAASEVAARVTAAVTLGSTRGQTAAHTHAAATVVGCGMLLGLSADELTAALSLALAQPRRVLLPAFMGSDAKFWVATAPILDAARSIQAARTGTRGLEQVLEAPGGVLEQLASVPLPDAMGGYGSRWHLRTLSIKAIPGCAYLTAAVEAAAGLGPLDLAEVKEVQVAGSIFTVGMEAESAPFVDGPNSPLPALGFSLGYNIAAALETGGLVPADLGPERLASEARWDVARSVRLTHDDDLTVMALAATAPVGAGIAWAGERARTWLASRGGSDELTQRVLDASAANRDDPEFRSPAKRVGAKVFVRMKDGRLLDAQRDAATGCCQESSANRLALAERKYMQESGPPAPDEPRVLELTRSYLEWPLTAR